MSDNPPRSPVILQVLPSLGTGGVERGTVDIAEAIVAAGGTAVVAARYGHLAKALQAVGAAHVDLPVHTKNPLRMVRNARLLAGLVRRYRVDLVHARSRAPAWSARAAARATGVPFVTTFHGLYGSRGALKRRYNAVMASGDRVIAVSRFVADHLRETYAADHTRIRVIHRGVDLSRFDPEAVDHSRVADLRAAWAVPQGHRIVLLPGRLTEWKGQLLLLRAMTRLERQSATLVLAGPAAAGSAYRERIERQAADFGLGEAVRMIGDCDDMPAAYLAADVVVNASTSPEAFGRVMAEAMAMQRPVVAFGHGAALEIIEHGRTGWLVPPLDVAALAEAIAAALDLGEGARRSLGEAARRKVCAEFGNDQMARQTLDVYEELLLTPFPSGRRR